jgi:hypothetical protein
MRNVLTSVIAMMMLSLAGQVCAQTQPPTKKCWFHCGTSITKSYDLSASNVSGDQIRGPATVQAENLNVLRYNYKFNIVISFSAAPDLWAKLQSAATPASSNPPEKPATVASKAGRPGPFSSKDKAIDALFAQADARLNDADNAIDNANNLITATVGDSTQACLTIPPTTSEITKETNCQDRALDEGVSLSATAVAKVKAGGQAVTALLQKTWTNPALLIGYINDALIPTSSIIVGTIAQWPNPDTVATLKRAALGWKAELANRSSKFTDSLTSVSGALVSAKKALTDIVPSLNSKVSTASAGDQTNLKTLIAYIQDEETKLDDSSRQLTKMQTLLSWATTENQRVLSAIPDLEQSSTKFTDFQTAQEALISWKTRMTDLRDRWVSYTTAKTSGKSVEDNPNPFSLSTAADCEFAFSRTKTTAITLTRADLMPGTTSTAPETVLSVSVECTSPFTVSAGVAFSTIEAHQFAIQASQATPPATGTVNKFVVTNNSNFHPLVLGMVHARFCELNERVAFHASFGLSGNFQSQSAGGSSAGFLIGPSMSLFRTMFFTPGLYIGTKTVIGGGFMVGDTVPSTITTVPLETSYTTGFGFAITFTKP